jgi:uncharacterized membrane protein
MSLVSKDPVARLAEAQSWLAPAEEPLQTAVRDAFHALGDETGRKVRNLLHGTWLHEPLHAVLVEVPVGTWTAAVVFDALAALGAGDKLDAAADASVVLGIVGALGAAVTGMNDWADTEGAPRRVGLVHALVNTGALGLFAASALARGKRGSRPRARGLAALGFVLVGLGAHLGGNLVYEHGVGVQDQGGLR